MFNTKIGIQKQEKNQSSRTSSSQLTQDKERCETTKNVVQDKLIQINDASLQLAQLQPWLERSSALVLPDVSSSTGDQQVYMQLIQEKEKENTSKKREKIKNY